MRVVSLSIACAAAVLAYACGGMTTSDVDAGSDSGGNDSACADGCASFVGDCADAACPSGSVCVTQPQGPITAQRCYPLPACGCGGKSLCECIGTCACGNFACTSGTSSMGCNGPISRREFKTDVAYVNEQQRASLAREALETRLATYRYKSEPEGAQPHLGFIIDDAPAGSPAVQADRTHVDLYGYTSMLLATVQQQQKQIDALKKQVDDLEKSRAR